MGVVVVLLMALAACSKGDDTTNAKPAASKSAKVTKQEGPAASATTPPLELSHEATPPATPPPSETSAAPTTPSLPAADEVPPGEVPSAEGLPTLPPGTTVEAAAPKVVKAFTNVAVLLDASGSMAGPIESDTKLHYAASTVKDLLVQPAPTGMQRAFGIRVFGSRSAAEQNDCDDVVLLAGLGAVDPKTIGGILNNVKAKGSAPIGKALEQATLEFPEAGDERDNVALLIADGADTCDQDLCATAERLHAGPKRVIVHVIGFDLDQAAEQQLRCVAQKTDGRFFLARNVAELHSAADEALHANLPYNLRVKSFAGSQPLATQVTLYRAGTQQVVEEGRSTGVKFFQLAPGSYDILVTYADAIEATKPSKFLKGVEVQASARAEQVVYFDLGTLELSGVAPDGQPATLSYSITNAGTRELAAQIDNTAGTFTATLSPGTYDISTIGPEVNGIPLLAKTEGVVVKPGEKAAYKFSFETGELFLRAETSRHTFIPGTYAILPPDQPEKVLIQGELPTDGKLLSLPIGQYLVRIHAGAALLQGTKPQELANVPIVARDRTQQLVTFPVGTMRLTGKNGSGTPVQTEFVLRRLGDPTIVARETSTGPASELILAPGHYHVTATQLGMAITPPPSMLWDDIEVAADQETFKEAVFHLGTLEIVGRDARENPLPTEVTIFRPENDQLPVATERSLSGTVRFTLTPGLYDLRTQDVSANGTVRPTIWLRGVAVAAGTTAQQSVKFTAGRVRLTCHGTNDIPVPCHFRIFTYGQDAPLYAGETTDQWQEFEMKPGTYYLEAGYHDTAQDHTLKKWINVTIAENQTVEEVIRF